jgi:hypothetical protein
MAVSVGPGETALDADNTLPEARRMPQYSLNHVAPENQFPPEAKFINGMEEL